MSEHQSVDHGDQSSELLQDDTAAVIVAPSLLALHTPRPASRVLSIDPALCDIFPLNPRRARGFVPREDAELLDSIQASGQQVPVVVRPSVANGRYEIVVGTRRLAAVREINKGGGDLMIVAEVRHLEDDEAWLLAETENVGRKAVSPLVQARSWSHACIRFYGGKQADMARALGVDKSVVSRALTLAQLPDVVFDLVKNRDCINFHFGAQIGPQLNNPETNGKLLAHAQALVDKGIKLSPAEAVRRLSMDPGAADAARPQAITAADHSRLGTWFVDAKGSGVLKLKPVPAGMKPADRKALLKEITARIEAHLQRD